MKNISPYFIIGFVILIIFNFNSCSDKKINKLDDFSAEYSEEEMEFVTSFIDFDNSLGSVRNENTNFMSISDAIDDYVDRLEDKLEDDKCPERFNLIFSKHLRAWENITNVTDKYPNMRGEMHLLFEKLAVSPDSMNFNTSLDSIWSTWDAVEIEIGKTVKYD